MRRTFLALTVVVGLAGPAAADDKVRVACVGDSITFGSGIKDREKNSYPAQLQAILGDKYEVRNYGVGGRTLLTKGDFPYTKEKAYKDALAFMPNVVVVKLGSNDSKPQNWKHKDEFEADYKALVGSFRELGSKPTVYLCTPVPAFPAAFRITDAVVKGEVKPKVEAVARDLKLPVIDLYEALSGKGELFPDKVHPNAEGAKVMAEAVAKAIQAAK
jgi:lysophospholipase L1-like esterase